MYSPTKEELARLKTAIQAALAIPFIDDIEDYIWEAIFSHSKNIPIVDPLFSIRSKQLFDIVDPVKKIGWSAKAIQWAVTPPCAFELVIQRADIFKKAHDLGFETLSKDSSTSQLGSALLKHWNGKIRLDSQAQGIKDARVCILLKSRDRKKFAYFEEDLAQYHDGELIWKWSDESKQGLQGIRKKDQFCIYRWYPNQKQLFERFWLCDNTPLFEIEPKRIPLPLMIDALLNILNNKT